METGDQSFGQSCTPADGASLTMKTPGTKLPVPGDQMHSGGVLRSDVRPAAELYGGMYSERVGAGYFACVLCEFVWGVKVLTIICSKVHRHGARVCLSHRGHRSLSRQIENRSGNPAPEHGLPAWIVKRTEL